ncbi:chemotaxis response regulator protein-glutamate methylesterase [Burkholderia pseudomallei]|uniref:chemotaxis-specific protein-glutamate methyltransferase CheB n=1 Tax=Burkholderia pseudomallei TaxID=28450 RepID=UPI00050E046D|nr:chemotaxis-specific protein-glutamate methyltransferase CheB [Burkholderia pseudomallei]APY96319.1 chemotaxis response regulator protein-glutamate methylesterase [Burkholderia pseudomallei]KGD53945.1 response regulator [Burkholderia pseudomallei]KGS67917.1 cheB methylesterase family protein [Burkholderia pseudomallei MSHR4868]KGS83375.1 cheB methylesterase family protein [Burkholderia pseudomallei MSHR7500]KGW42117.1 response regulator [Burkholderia pseudomallei MSHR1000]
MIRVLVIDDSATMRILLKKLIDKNEHMECVGVAPNPVAAQDLLREARPDVITLDIEMPKMNGLDFLDRIMRLMPVAVIMISTLTEAGSESALRALELGAIDFIAKPKLDFAEGVQAYAEEIYRKIETAGRAKVKKLTRDVPPVRMDAEPPAKPLLAEAGTEGRVVAVGASTGGTEAVKELLLGLPADCPPLLIAQHMPEPFMRSLAKRLDLLCAMRVKMAEDGETLRRGCAYIAPGHSNLTVEATAAGYACRIVRNAGEAQAGSSVDELFRSVAAAAGARAVGVVLTGSGSDGAAGARAMMAAGAFNIAQDAETSVVYSMPDAAIAACGINEILPLEKIAGKLMELDRA